LNSQARRRVCLGRITKPHGLRGEVRAWLAVDADDTLAAIQTLEVDGTPYRLTSVRVVKNSYILGLAGISSRDAAQGLAGREIYVDPAQLPPLPEGEFYQFQVIGLAVYLAESAAYVGEVKEILATPAHDVYVIQGRGQEYLVPAVASAVLSIEPEQGRMIVAAAGLTTANGAY